MATNNVRTVDTNLLNQTAVKTAQQALQEDRERERKAFEARMGKDRVEISTESKKISVAGSAEPALMKTASKTAAQKAHESIQASRDELKKAYQDAGGKVGKDVEANLDAAASTLLDTLQAEIDKQKKQNGGSDTKAAAMEAKREKLLGALEKYRDALVDAENGSSTATESSDVHTASAPEETGSNASSMSDEEKHLWTQMDGELKSVGVDRAGETDVDQVQKKFMQKIGAEVGDLQAKEKDLNKKLGDVQAEWKSANDPKKKSELETSMNQIKAQLVQINQRKLDLQKVVANFTSTSDALLSYHVSKELGLRKEEKKTKTPAKVQSASVSTTGSSTTQTGGAPTTGTQSPQSSLTTQSVGDGTTYPSVEAGGEQGPHLQTASAGGDAYVAPGASGSGGLKISSVDLSGTSMAISNTSASSRAESNRMAKLLKQLIAAAQSGNMDAVVSGVVIMSRRMSLMTAAIGANAIKAMQQYETQMGTISSQISALSSKDPDYSSKLAGLNTQVSMASSSRQQIVQTLQQVMSGMQESDELAHSVVGKYGQIGERLAQFQ